MRTGADPPRRLLFVSHSKEVGGAESYLRSLILYSRDALRRDDHDAPVTLVCRPDTALDDWVREIQRAGVEVERIDLKRLSDYARLLRLARRADLVHLVLAYPVGKYQLIAALLARLARRPLVLTHQLPIDLGEIAMSSLKRAAWSAAFRSYRVIAPRHIAVSQAGRGLLIRRYGFAPGRVTVIYNGVDLRRFALLDPGSLADARRRMGEAIAPEGWSGELLLAITVARLNEQKGLPDLLQAAAIVKGRSPNARFLIVGGGELEASLREQIRRLGLADTVALAGQQSSGVVATWVAASDLFVLPSHREGLPLALVEAMAAGCAPVATRVGGVPEVITGDSMGLLVPPNDPVRLAQAIAALLHDAGRRAAIGAAARQRARDAFDIDRCVAATFAVYQEIVKNREARR